MNIFTKIWIGLTLYEIAQKSGENRERKAELKSENPRRYRMIWLLKLCFLVIACSVASWIGANWIAPNIYE